MHDAMAKTMADDMRMQLHSLQWGQFSIGNLALNEPSNSSWRLTLDDVGISAFTMDRLVLNCHEGAWQWTQPECQRGEWRLQLGEARYTGEFGLHDAGKAAEITAKGFQANWRIGQQLKVVFDAMSIAGMEHLWSAHTEWPAISSAIVDGVLRIDLSKKQTQADVDLSLTQLGFDNSTGDIAAVDVALSLAGQLQQQVVAENWSFDMTGIWSAGEMLFGANYLPTPNSEVKLTLVGSYQAATQTQSTQWLLHHIMFDDPNTLTLSAAANWKDPDIANWRPQSLTVETLQADINGLQNRYLSGLLGQISLDQLQTAGSIELAGHYGPDIGPIGEVQKPQRFTLTLNDIELVDAQSRFIVRGLQGAMNWHEQLPLQSDSSLLWEHLQIYRLPFEPTELRFAIGDDGFAMQPDTRVGFLDAGLLFHELKVVDLMGEAPTVAMDAELLPVELIELTTIMGWPSFGGQVGGRIPGVELSNGVWRLGGQLALDVFDGQIVLSNLSAERPFGVLPTFNASVWMERVQLEPLTAAFEIGRITGPIDGQIKDLRLLDWQPVQFDAWLRTSNDPKTKRRISQRAVDTISSVGGGVGSGLQSTVLRLFEDFGYKQLGFSCRLLNGVCALDGVAKSPTGPGFLIVEGSGVPKLQVIGHNRQVDWRRMLEQLKAATESSGPSVD